MKKAFRLELGKTYLFRDPATVRRRRFDTFIWIVKVMEDGYYIGDDDSIYSIDGGSTRE